MKPAIVHGFHKDVDGLQLLFLLNAFRMAGTRCIVLMIHMNLFSRIPTTSCVGRRECRYFYLGMAIRNQPKYANVPKE